MKVTWPAGSACVLGPCGDPAQKAVSMTLCSQVHTDTGSAEACTHGLRSEFIRKDRRTGSVIVFTQMAARARVSHCQWRHAWFCCSHAQRNGAFIIRISCKYTAARPRPLPELPEHKLFHFNSPTSPCHAPRPFHVHKQRPFHVCFPRALPARAANARTARLWLWALRMPPSPNSPTGVCCACE